jgi:hypothetical protein
VTAASSITTPAALAPAFAAWPATSSIEAAATFARLATSSRSAISPILTSGPCVFFPHARLRPKRPRDRRGLPAIPTTGHSRYIEAAVSGVLLGCLYLPNGNPSPCPSSITSCVRERVRRTIGKVGVPALSSGRLHRGTRKLRKRQPQAGKERRERLVHVWTSLCSTARWASPPPDPNARFSRSRRFVSLRVSAHPTPRLESSHARLGTELSAR